MSRVTEILDTDKNFVAVYLNESNDIDEDGISIPTRCNNLRSTLSGNSLIPITMDSTTTRK